jgi:hypothetical protein
LGREAVGIALALLMAGCADPFSFFNPQFIQTLGVGQTVANLPGEAPAVLVEVDNQTNRPIEFLLTWRESEGEVERLTGGLAPELKDGLVLFCPLEEVTLGDVSDLDATGAIVRLGNGESNDPLIEVEPFGVLLQQGVNYDCGDSITFTVLPSSASLSGYQVFAFIRRSGAQAATETGSP